MRFVVIDPSGLHARPAARFVQIASRFESRVQIGIGERVADAKSLVSLLGLGVRPGSEIVLRAEGEDATQAIAALAHELAPYVSAAPTEVSNPEA